jgi:hypothetical protein
MTPRTISQPTNLFWVMIEPIWAGVPSDCERIGDNLIRVEVGFAPELTETVGRGHES